MVEKERLSWDEKRVMNILPGWRQGTYHSVLARLLGISPQRLSAVMRSLEKRGLVSRLDLAEGLGQGMVPVGHTRGWMIKEKEASS